MHLSITALRAVMLGWLSLGVILAGTWFVAVRQSRASDLPIIIYLVDTLRADRLGLYGYDRDTSPYLDSLAAESVVFERAYAPAPWTLPSVASLLTSTFLCEHGMEEPARLSRELPTLAENLQTAGFRTAGYSANVWVGPLTGLERGYERFEQRATGFALAVDLLLDEWQDEPFFVYLHTIEPHAAYQAESRHVASFGKLEHPDARASLESAMREYQRLMMVDWLAGRPSGQTDATALIDAEIAEFRELGADVDLLYDATVAAADENLGRLIDVLRQRGIWDRAIFIFLSDHGEEFGEHGGWLHDQSVYDELLHVPLLVHFPENRFAGRRVTAPVSLIDLAPTVLDLLNHAELCAGCRGESWLPLLEREAESSDDPKLVGMRMNRNKYYRQWKEGRGDVNLAFRTEHWKGIWNAEPDSVELYDMRAGPGETADAGATRADLVGQLGTLARDQLAACQVENRPAPRSTIDEASLQQLRALGYMN